MTALNEADGEQAALDCLATLDWGFAHGATMRCNVH